MILQKISIMAAAGRGGNASVNGGAGPKVVTIELTFAPIMQMALRTPMVITIGITIIIAGTEP